MTTLSVIQDFIKDKSVLLIGNGVHTEKDLDSYNIVIRMNNGIQKGKADIWVNNLIQYQNRRWSWDKVDFKYMLRLNAEDSGIKLLRGYPNRYIDSTYFWNPKEYLELSKKVGYTQPFTGTTALHWLAMNTQPTSITVIGMDFFKKGCPVSTHKPELDRAYIDGVIKDDSRIHKR